MSKTTVPVASDQGCQSPDTSYDGVFDLIGNVEEWEDNCGTASGAQDVCNPRGLSYGMGAAMPTCSSDSYATRGEASAIRGFRCCTD